MTPPTPRVAAGLSLAAMLAACPTARAGATDGGWVEQSIPLSAGWNFVWLTVDPTPAETESVFAQQIGDGSLESVWQFSPPPNDDADGFWLVFDPDAPDFVNTLAMINGSRAYFVEVNAPGTLTVTGRPILREQLMSAVSGTPIGASTAPGGTTFRKFLAFGDVDDKVAQINRYDPVGDDFEVVGLDTIAGLQPGVAYWVSMEQTFPYTGPVHVSGPLEGCQLRVEGYLKTIVIEVPRRDVDRTITVRALDSAEPPAGRPGDAGGPDAWLQYRDPDNQWVAFPPNGVTLTVLADETRAAMELDDGSREPLDIRAQRFGLPTASVEHTNSLYQAVLEIADEDGNVVEVAVGMEKPPSTGTWTGVVELTDVVPNPMVPNPTTTAKPMSFGVVLEIPDAGSPDPVRLLNKACVALARDGATMSYAYDPVLFPDPVVMDVTGADFRSGTIATGTQVLLGRYDPPPEGGPDPPAPHPLNPYRHRYNPKHRNGYDVTRTITLSLDPSGFDKGELTDLILNSALVGSYSEAIAGLTPEPIVVSGTVRLYKLSDGVGLDGRCSCGLSTAGSCTSASNSTPGCADAGCCNLVCEAEPLCCTDAWNAAGCASLAGQLCLDQ